MELVIQTGSSIMKIMYKYKILFHLTSDNEQCAIISVSLLGSQLSIAQYYIMQLKMN
jgi:phosphoserine aminotransferase